MTQTVKRYLDLEGLKIYDEKIKAFARGIGDKIKQDIVNGAAEEYDTLKEIADYITTHKKEYDALVDLVDDDTVKNDLAAAVTRITVIESKIDDLTADTATAISEEEIDRLFGA